MPMVCTGADWLAVAEDNSITETDVLVEELGVRATTIFPGAKDAALTEENAKRKSANPAKNRDGMMEDSKDEKIRPGAECTPSALLLIAGDATNTNCSTFTKILGLFCDNMMALIFR